MITIDSISKSFGSHVVVEDVSLVINARGRIAVLGKNGSGKTTLLSMISGMLAPDAGTIHYDQENVGYVPQDLTPVSMPDVTQFEEWRLLYALQQVGLDPALLQRPLQDLSGGQRTRLSIAFVLARDPSPSVLLLDEPTNNLDKEGMEWLSGFLASYAGAVVMVSHDRSFVNANANKLWILNGGKVREFNGSYDDYIQFKQDEQGRIAKEHENYQQERRKVERLIRDASDRAKRGIRDQRSRDNDKFVKNYKNEYVQNSSGRRAKALQSRLEQLGEVNAPQKEKRYRLTLTGEVNASKKIVTLNRITKKYHNHTVLNDFTMTVLGSDRIWVKGRNGSGKSTLLKIAAGILKPDDGTVGYGHEVKVGYFSQDVYGLDRSASGYEILSKLYVDDETIYKAAKGIEIRPELLRRKIDTLSRGQQAKIGFLKLLLMGYDLLVLDEPTNHLDIPTKESIEHALDDYRGALLIASHDEYFVRRIGVNKEISLEPEFLQ